MADFLSDIRINEFMSNVFEVQIILSSLLPFPSSSFLVLFFCLLFCLLFCLFEILNSLLWHHSEDTLACWNYAFLTVEKTPLPSPLEDKINN